jgi:hypothetical protein
VSQLSRESCGHVVMGYSRYDQGWVADPIPWVTLGKYDIHKLVGRLNLQSLS